MIIVDELHALAPGKRGDLLALGLARLRQLAPDAISFGLSATVAEPDNLRRWLVPQAPGRTALADLVDVPRSVAAPADLQMLETEARLPWAGHSANHAMAEIYNEIGKHRLTLVFVNTRMQAEFVFQRLWSSMKPGDASRCIMVRWMWGSAGRSRRRCRQGAGCGCLHLYTGSRD